MGAIYDMFGSDQLTQRPSRVTLDTATLIGYTATSHPENIPECRILKACLSDHYLVYCIRKLSGSISR